MKFTTWTRRRNGVTIHVPAETFTLDVPDGPDAARRAAELHMVRDESADAVAVRPHAVTRYFARRARIEPGEMGDRAVIYAEEIPHALEVGP